MRDTEVDLLPRVSRKATSQANPAAPPETQQAVLLTEGPPRFIYERNL